MASKKVPGKVVRVSLMEKTLLYLAICMLIYRSLGKDYAIGITVAYAIYVYLYVSDKHSLWKKHNIPGPSPMFLIGNSWELWMYGLLKCHEKWCNKYGKVFGVYWWTEPQLVVIDADVNRRMLVSDFNVFMDRRCVQRVVGETDAECKKTEGLYENMLVFLPSRRWKDVRNTVTPAFTPAKMKLMTPLLNESIHTLQEILSKYCYTKESVEIKKLFLAFTMDVIATVALACNVEAQKRPGNPVEINVHHAVKVLMGAKKNRIAGFFPWLSTQLDQIFHLKIRASHGGEAFFYDVLPKVINERRQNPKKTKPDFLQLVINASRDAKLNPQDEDEPFEDEYIAKVEGGKKIPLDDEEIIAQCVLFLVGGHETIASAITWTAYTLAHHQDIQDKARAELRNFKGKVEDITLDAGPYCLPYLDAIVHESLRLYPPTTSFGRVSGEEYKIRDGMTVPKGIGITMPSYAVQHHEDYYPNPLKFDPDRFNAENRAKRDPLTFITFGYGPRNCLGQRFGHLEVIFCLAHILPKFRFTVTKDTEAEPPKVWTNEVLLTPCKPLMIGVEKV